jgi:hypothetical protein
MTQKQKQTSLVIPPTTAAPTELVEMFIQHRKELKNPLTQTLLELNVRRLEKMERDGIDVIAAIEHSIASGYLGVFPAPKDALKENGFDNFFDYANYLYDDWCD